MRLISADVVEFMPLCLLVPVSKLKKRVTSRLYRLFRDLKIRGRDKLRRLPEVNLHNETCAQKPQIRALAVLVSWRTPFSLFCRHLENVRILGLFLSTIRHNRFPFQI